MSQTSTVNDVFNVSEWFGVGIGDAWTMVLQAEIDYLLGREIVVFHIIRGNLRDFVVLTVQATEVTTRTGNRKTCTARMEVIQRFLLNGIDSQRTGLSIDLADKHTILIATTTTDARPAIRNPTMVRTEQALHLSIT
jgi:hypothetical protein